MIYSIGDRVKRIEARPQVAAVVMDVHNGMEEQILELSYEEGGRGWWPVSAVEPDAES